MDENRIPESVCGYLADSGLGVEFIPETWREGAASVWLTGGGTTKHYVDGSRVVSVPFEIRLRCGGATIGDRLEAVRFFTGLAEWLRYGGSGEMEIRALSGASKSAVYDDGSEEYRAGYEVKYLVPGRHEM